MRIVSENNLLVDGFQLSAGVPVDAEKPLAMKLLKFPGVKKAPAELLGNEDTPSTVSVKE